MLTIQMEYRKSLPRKSVFIVSCKVVVGQPEFTIDSANERANVVRMRCSPQPDVLTPTELLPFLAQLPHPQTPACHGKKSFRQAAD